MARCCCRTGTEVIAAEDAVQSASVLHAVQGPWRYMGHMVHMPSHTHIRTGRQHPASIVNLFLQQSMLALLLQLCTPPGDHCISALESLSAFYSFSPFFWGQTPMKPAQDTVTING